MKKVIFLLLSTSILSSCSRENWIFYTRTCVNTIGLYNKYQIDSLKNLNEPFLPSITTKNSIKWYELEKNVLNKYHHAKIKNGSRFIIVVKSRKKDEGAIKEIVCDYWKN